MLLVVFKDEQLFSAAVAAVKVRAVGLITPHHVESFTCSRVHSSTVYTGLQVLHHLFLLYQSATADVLLLNTTSACQRANSFCRMVSSGGKRVQQLNSSSYCSVQWSDHRGRKPPALPHSPATGSQLEVISWAGDKFCPCIVCDVWTKQSGKWHCFQGVRRKSLCKENENESWEGEIRTNHRMERIEDGEMGRVHRNLLGRS